MLMSNILDINGKKAQGMPMETIVMIIVVLLVLAGVGIFFFQQFGTGTTGTNSAQCIQLCQGVNAYYASNTSMADTEVQASDSWKKFDSNCNGVICKVGSWSWTG
jgi:hypothetical protein